MNGIQEEAHTEIRLVPSFGERLFYIVIRRIIPRTIGSNDSERAADRSMEMPCAVNSKIFFKKRPHVPKLQSERTLSVL